jgi:hypothetical protein
MQLAKGNVPERTMGYKIIDPRVPNPPRSFEKNFRWLAKPDESRQVSRPRPAPSPPTTAHPHLPQKGALGPEHGKLPRAKRTAPPHRQTLKPEPMPVVSQEAQVFYNTFTSRKDSPKFSSVVVAIMVAMFFMFISMLYSMVATAFTAPTIQTVARYTRSILDQLHPTAGQSADMLSSSISSDDFNFPSR